MMNYTNPNDYWLHELYKQDKSMKPEDAMRYGCIGAIVYAAAFFVMLCLCALFGSCSPKVIENVVTRTDTCFIQKMQRDSVFVKDSIYVHEWTANDTVRIVTDRWHVRWKDKVVRDTAYISQRDTVRVTKTVQVAKPLTQWQQMRLYFANAVLVALALLACIVLARWWLQRRKLL